MIVKCQTFKATSHHPTATARHAYLEKEGRAVGGVSTQNINDNDRWYAEMDRTSASYHLRGSVVGREFVLSPSAEDGATPEQVRDFAHEWLERNFPTAEAAVVIHCDNKERTARGLEPIPHAHVYVNAPDLEAGKKITLSNTRVRELHDSAQELSRARGWSEQERYFDRESGKVRTIESKRTEYERRPKWQRIAERTNPDYDASAARKAGVGRMEYEQAKKGREFEKTRVRRCLKEARDEVIADRSKNLADALKERGVAVARAKGGDYKYRIEGSRRSFKGATLGEQFERGRLAASIKAGREAALQANRGIDIGR
ncbi:MAG: relaxase/mobilization nuclease domain-containing protein [Eggerthellaceae bacterium]|nr:relaxase/mobilization nuclease domain-containing protein [Eggerthellaceae bacterium]